MPYKISKTFYVGNSTSEETHIASEEEAIRRAKAFEKDGWAMVIDESTDEIVYTSSGGEE